MKITAAYLVISAFIFSSLLTSCAFLQKGEFAQRKYYDFPRTKHSDTRTASIVTQDEVTRPVIINAERPTAELPLLTASVNNKEFISPKAENYNSSKPGQRKTIKISNDVEQIKNPTISFKKAEIKKQAIKNLNHLPSTDPDVMLVILVILAIFIPPLAVYLKNNEINKWFWITLLLWLFGGGFAFGGLGYGGLLWAAAVVIAILYVLNLI